MPRRTAFDPLSAALRLLSFRARSTFELIERLKEKGFSPAAIGPAIEHLSEAGYLNDEAFAREHRVIASSDVRRLARAARRHLAVGQDQAPPRKEGKRRRKEAKGD